MRRPWSVATLLLLTVLIAACGGGDGPTEPLDDDSGGPDAPTVKEDPSFSSDIVPIFTRAGCTASGCHGSAAQAGLNLASSPYTALVNVPSVQTGELRVIPGNAGNSYLVKKLEGRQDVGQRMPVGGVLGSTDLTNIKNWITQGAKNN